LVMILLVKSIAEISSTFFSPEDRQEFKKHSVVI